MDSCAPLRFKQPRVVILDRDGVINQDSLQYIKSVDEFVFLPGSLDAIARLTTAGYTVGVATNQSGVSRGYYDEDTLTAIHLKLQQHVEQAGGRIDDIVYCTHLPTDGCLCRKPNPGMLFDLATRFHVEPRDCFFIGDKITDIQAAETAGAKPMLVLSPMTDHVARKAYPHVPVFPSLLACVSALLEQDESS